MVHCPVSFLSVQRLSLGGKWWANMISSGCRPGCGCMVWILSNTVNPRLAKRVRASTSTRWRLRGRSVPPSSLTGEEEEGGEVERAAVAGITSHGGLELLKIRKWYFPLFQMSSSGFLFIILFLEDRALLWNMQQSPTDLHTRTH